MALNSSGPISIAGTTAGVSIQKELGGTGTAQMSLNCATVRTLAGVPSGAIIMPTNFYGKSSGPTVLSYTFAANTANASLNVASISGYVAGSSAITVTVNSGVYLYSTSNATPGLTLTGGTTGDTVTLVNNGFIMGQGGVGGGYSVSSSAGGTALKLGFNTTVNNTNASAYIGGGGGGGGSKKASVCGGLNHGTGGGGGGAGGGGGGISCQCYFNLGGGPIRPTAGTGGGVGSVGGSTSADSNSAGDSFWAAASGSGGGRVFPGTGGVGSNSGNVGTIGTGGGAGGGGGSTYATCCCAGSNYLIGQGGAGGASNAVGGVGIGFSCTCYSGPAGGGGGGWGASGGLGFGGTLIFAPGGGGKAVCLNGKTVTWVSGNTTRVYGAVS